MAAYTHNDEGPSCVNRGYCLSARCVGIRDMNVPLRIFVVSFRQRWSSYDLIWSFLCAFWQWNKEKQKREAGVLGTVKRRGKQGKYFLPSCRWNYREKTSLSIMIDLLLFSRTKHIVCVRNLPTLPDPYIHCVQLGIDVVHINIHPTKITVIKRSDEFRRLPSRLFSTLLWSWLLVGRIQPQHSCCCCRCCFCCRRRSSCRIVLLLLEEELVSTDIEQILY